MVQLVLKLGTNAKRNWTRTVDVVRYSIVSHLDDRAAHRDTPNEDASKMVSIYENMFFYTNLLYVYLVYI